AGLADNRQNGLDIDLVGCPCRGDNVLFDHRAAEIVAAVLKRQLADLRSHGHPGRLNVLNVVQYDPADRHSLKVLPWSLSLPLQIRVVRLERPWNEGQEAF